MRVHRVRRSLLWRLVDVGRADRSAPECREAVAEAVALADEGRMGGSAAAAAVACRGVLCMCVAKERPSRGARFSGRYCSAVWWKERSEEAEEEVLPAVGG